MIHSKGSPSSINNSNSDIIPMEELQSIDSSINSDNKPCKINHLALLLSQHFWFICILLFSAYGFLFPRYHPAVKYHSAAPVKPWNTTEDPKIFLHVSDIHLAKAEFHKRASTRSLIYTMKALKPDFHLVTGDFVDNYGEKNWPKIGKQVREDWELWRDLWEEEGDGSEIIDIPGNHDMWGIIDPFSSQNLYLDYSHTYNRENTKTFRDFVVRTMVKEGIKLVLVNVYRFPDGHPPFTYWPHPTSEMLDYIEEEIDKAGPCFVATHYPVDHHWWIVKSSKGHSFEEIMQKENIRAVFTGHFHPYDTIIVHHKQGAVEYLGCSAFQNKKIGYVSLDNDRLVYTELYTDITPKKYFLIHPIPLEQLSSHQVFNEKNTEIRLISYYNYNVTIKVSGDFEGVLKFNRVLKNGAFLYSMPLNVKKEGVYKIHLTGHKCNITREFYIGESYQGKKEEAVCVQRGLFFTRLNLIPLVLSLLWIWFPIDILPSSKEAVQWIEGTSSQPCWKTIFFFSPNIIRERGKSLPNIVRIIMFLSVIYPIFLPIHFYKPIHGNFGFTLFIFCIIGKSYAFDEWALQLTMFYYLLICMPNTIFITSNKYRGQTWVWYLNLTFVISLIIGGWVVNYRWIGEAVTIPNLFLNPAMVLAPLFIHFIFYKYIFKNKNTKNYYQVDKATRN